MARSEQHVVLLMHHRGKTQVPRKRPSAAW
jgi:hypothetical protein